MTVVVSIAPRLAADPGMRASANTGRCKPYHRSVVATERLVVRFVLHFSFMSIRTISPR